MDPNTHSASPASGLAALAAEFTALAAELTALAAHDPQPLTDTAVADQVLQLRQLLDRLEGHWLQRLAAADARGAAGAEDGTPAPSTASWLRNRLRLSAGAATSAVRTARALFRGPLSATGQAVLDGQLSPAHASVLAASTQELPTHTTVAAEPVLLDAARRLDPARLRRILGHLRQITDPDGADRLSQRRHERRGVWLTPTWEGMVALDGLLEPEAGQTLLAALEPLARPADADDTRSGGQRTADALTELARRALEAGRLPQSGGVRPQLLVTVDLDSLLGGHGAVGGDLGGFGPLDPEACRRLACDATVTRVLVTRQPPGHHQPDHGPHSQPQPATQDLGGTEGLAGLAAQVRAAMTLLPPVLGGAPNQPLEVGRATRVVSPAQRAALIVRDNGCVFPDCDRPPPWCDAHHLIPWLDGGPTDLPNLALLCRAHHRAIHEGGWRLTRDPDGGLTATPPHRRPRTAA